MYARTLALDRAANGPDHWGVGYDLTQLGGLRLEMGDVRAADTLFGAALANYERSLPPDNPYRIAPLLGRGEVLIRQGRAGQAEAVMRRAVAIAEKALPPDHWLLAQAESNLGGCLVARGRLEEAEALVLGGYRRLAAVLSAEDARVRAARQRVVALYHAMGRPDRAAEYR
jgi:hypothetical protein